MKKPFVSGDVDDSGFDAVVKQQTREPKVERHTTQLFLQPPIGIRPGQRADERRLPMVDVTRCPKDVHETEGAMRRRGSPRSGPHRGWARPFADRSARSALRRGRSAADA